MFRTVESKALIVAMFAVMSGCSSSAADETDSDGAGGDGSSNAGTGGEVAAAGASGSGAGAMGGSGGVTGAAGGAGGATAGAGNDAPPGFASDVWPILVADCSSASCHGDGSFLPQHAHSDVEIAYEEAKVVADTIAGRVSGQLMPIMPQFCGPAPGLGECLSVAEVQLIQAWAEAGAPY
jgi:hypothetical protein